MPKDINPLSKRARAKYLSKKIATDLINENPSSSLKNSYYGTLLCAHNIYQEGTKFRSSYCKQRWCVVCNRIRTAKLITGYLPVLELMEDPYFVTLTKQTVSEDQLLESIALMESVWRKVVHSDAGKRRKIRGFRKCECTIRQDDKYHYHYHVIIEGKEAAEWLVGAWLQRLPDVANAKGQDCRPADEGSLKEMFKYFTKLVTTNKDNTKELYPATKMDVIFRSLKNKRVIQPFGDVHPIVVEEDDPQLEVQEYSFTSDGLVVWKWRDSDWHDPDGMGLTGYVPSTAFKNMINRKN